MTKEDFHFALERPFWSHFLKNEGVHFGQLNHPIGTVWLAITISEKLQLFREPVSLKKMKFGWYVYNELAHENV